MATTQEQVDVLKQQVAQLATKSQWQQLVDLLNVHKADTDAQILSLTNRLAAAESEIHSLKTRVYALENP